MGLFLGLSLLGAAFGLDAYEQYKREKLAAQYDYNPEVDEVFSEIRANRRDDQGVTIGAYMNRAQCNLNRALYNMAYHQCLRKGIRWSVDSAYLWTGIR
ncbi:MAG: hypothetical protein IJ484_09795 [Oscillospiraceae bacterium]|nr:hypothetical protein [Oscillospiraceae bacterium]